MSGKSKRFNNSYNYSYNRKLPVTYDQHAMSRLLTRDIGLELVQETILTGKIIQKECRGRLACFERYFGKLNITCTVMAYFYDKSIEVRTIWKRQGR